MAALEEYRRNPKGPPLTPLRKVTKRVYAFPGCARVDKDAPKVTDLSSLHRDQLPTVQQLTGGGMGFRRKWG